jgi:hypothetical protein
MLAALALSGIVLPLSGAAERLGDYEPFPGYQRTERDLGSWDALLTGHDRHARPLTVRFVETNTMGCDGRCVHTRLESLTPRTSLGMPGPWWTALMMLMGPGVGAPGSDLGNAQRLGSDAVFSVAPVVGVVATAKGPKAVLVDPTPTRYSLDHLLPDRRVVTVFGETAHGVEVQVLRIGYTRRASSPAPSR